MFYPYTIGFRSEYIIGYILVGIAALLMALAQHKVTSNYRKYSKIANSRGITGEQIARMILDSNGLQDIPVFSVQGQLTDHYNPSKRTINLSQGIYDGTSIASLAVAAHECGHAIQHKEGYKALVIRDALVPLANVSQILGWIAIAIGLAASWLGLAWVGVALMSVIFVFQIVTLPVEFDASRRALKILETGYLTSNEYIGARNMLTAAALTYVASAFASLMSILRIVLIIFGGSRRD